MPLASSVSLPVPNTHKQDLVFALDVAVGAYESGHAVVLRGQPIITFQPHLTTSTSRISLKTSNFSSTACLSYIGSYVPSTVGKHSWTHHIQRGSTCDVLTFKICVIESFKYLLGSMMLYRRTDFYD